MAPAMTEAPAPEVSVFIRVRNEAKALVEVLAGLRAQAAGLAMEVVVLDNESDDDTVAVAQRANARVFSLPREHFGYGRALNLGARLCRGDIMIMLSAHSVPTSAGWLATLIA